MWAAFRMHLNLSTVCLCIFAAELVIAGVVQPHRVTALTLYHRYEDIPHAHLATQV